MLPRPIFYSPPEPYAIYLPETECDPTPKPGVEMFRDFVVSQIGGGYGGITRPCDWGSASGHKAGRAWDWTVNINDPDDVSRVHELFDWLLANEQEMARRVGITYMIWANKSWRSYRGDPNEWSPYDGYDEHGHCPNPPCRNPHTDHVHFSFSTAGSDGDTSFYEWIRQGQPSELVLTPDSKLAQDVKPSPLYLVGGFIIGSYGTMLISKKLQKA